MHYVRGLYVDCRGMQGSTLGRVVTHSEGRVQVQLHQFDPQQRAMVYEGDLHTYDEAQVRGVVTDLREWMAVAVREHEATQAARRMEDLEDLGFPSRFAASCVMCNNPPFERVMAMRAQGRSPAAISQIFEDCLD